jgi:hypothetical protein
MNAAVIAAAGITSLALFLFYAESQALTEGHARARAQFLNAARWGLVIALSWLLIPAAEDAPGPERAATIIGLTVLIGAVLLVPLRWFVRMSGREGYWELRRAKLEVSRLANRVKQDRNAVTSARIQRAADRLRHLRTPDTAELCDLMIAELEDLKAGEEFWLEGGRRSIRIDHLSRALWSEDMPPPDNEPDEATFRWYLYKLFGRMMEIGALEASDGGPSRDDLSEFRELIDSLEEYRRPDTDGFIETVLRSAAIWLADPAAGPWIRSYDFEALGPAGLEEIQWIWGREAAMWGAYLDGDDLRAIKRDLARRSLGPGDAAGAAPDPVAQPAADQDFGSRTQTGAQAPLGQVKPVNAKRAKGTAKPLKGVAGPVSGAANPTNEVAKPTNGSANQPPAAAEAGAPAGAGAAKSTRGRSTRLPKSAAGQK